jgi:hypothetical protein
VISNPGNKSVNENALLAFSLSATDVNGDAISYSMSGGPTGSTFAGNTFSWTPTFTQSGSYVATFYAQDNGSPVMSDTQAITITVNNVNNPPVLANPGNKSVNENALLAFSLSATDVNGDAITYSMSGGPTGSALTGNTFSWTPTFTQSGSYVVTFYAQDNGSPVMSDTQAITITVNNVNNPPVLANPGNKSVNENALLTFAIFATDANGDAITYSMSGGPAGASLSGNTFSLTPSYSQAGIYQIGFYATDEGTPVMSDTQTITVTVNEVNRPPVLVSPGDRFENENVPFSFILSATDPDGNAITFSATDLPSGAALTDSTFSWTPDTGASGIYTVQFFAADDGNPALSDSQAVTITVSP